VGRATLTCKMKAPTKIVWPFLIGLLIVIVAYLNSAYYRANRFSEEARSTLASFVAKYSSDIEMRETHGDLTIIIGTMPPVWTIPSGPPVFVYNSQGNLLLYSRDVGTDKEVLKRFPDALKMLERRSMNLRANQKR
jgi:hypothetical protein